MVTEVELARRATRRWEQDQERLAALRAHHADMQAQANGVRAEINGLTRKLQAAVADERRALETLVAFERQMRDRP